MQKYAAWKAADINKALREGRQPIPGNLSPPANAAADFDAAPAEQHAAAAPDFAFPSAPKAAAAEGPRYPGGVAQSELLHAAVDNIRGTFTQGADIRCAPTAPTVPSAWSGRPPRDPSYDLPSVPQPDLESAPSNVSSEAEGLTGTASADYSEADTDEDQPRYVRGQKVLYDAFDKSAPVRGTVAKVLKSGSSLH